METSYLHRQLVVLRLGVEFGVHIVLLIGATDQHVLAPRVAYKVLDVIHALRQRMRHHRVYRLRPARMHKP